jgi:hypothetical protein
MLVEENCSYQAALHWAVFFIPQRPSIAKPAYIFLLNHPACDVASLNRLICRN